MRIVSWYQNDKVVYESPKESVRDAVIEAVRRESPLMNADLKNAYLRDANLAGANFAGAHFDDADLFHVKFWGRGGSTKIKKAQLESFLKALGIVVEE